MEFRELIKNAAPYKEKNLIAVVTRVPAVESAALAPITKPVGLTKEAIVYLLSDPSVDFTMEAKHGGSLEATYEYKEVAGRVLGKLTRAWSRLVEKYENLDADVMYFELADDNLTVIEAFHAKELTPCFYDARFGQKCSDSNLNTEVQFGFPLKAREYEQGPDAIEAAQKLFDAMSIEERLARGIAVTAYVHDVAPGADQSLLDLSDTVADRTGELKLPSPEQQREQIRLDSEALADEMIEAELDAALQSVIKTAAAHGYDIQVHQRPLAPDVSEQVQTVHRIVKRQERPE